VVAAVLIALAGTATATLVALSRSASTAATPGTLSRPPSTAPVPAVGVQPALVTVPYTSVTMPVTLGWLPAEVAAPRQGLANLPSGRRSLIFAVPPPDPPLEQVGVSYLNIATTRAPETLDTNPGVGAPVTATSDTTVELRSRQVRQYVVVRRIIRQRQCTLIWTERDGLSVYILVQENTADADPPATCETGQRIARELRTEAYPMPRAFRPEVMPTGYTLVSVSRGGEAWCPTSQVTDACLGLAVDSGTSPEGKQIAVHEHVGVLTLAQPGSVTLTVPHVFRLHVPEALGLTENDLIRLAEATNPRAGW
jgi:hypothetical protein